MLTYDNCISSVLIQTSHSRCQEADNKTQNIKLNTNQAIDTIICYMMAF